MAAVLIGNYSVQQVIGEGTYGKAILCRDEKSRQTVVLKEISLAKMANVEKEDIISESQNLKAMNHPNIVKTQTTFIEKKKFYVVNEFIDGTTLATIIKDANGLSISEQQILDYFIEVCFAVKYLHDRKIVHRNLHSRNIFVTRYNVVKVGDPAFAKVLDHSAEYDRANYGTPYNMSPEVCCGCEYSQKSDIWALGCLLYEMCTLKPVFALDKATESVMKILVSCQPEIPNIYSVDLNNLISSMLLKSADERPGINDILQIPIVRERIENLFMAKLHRLEFTEPMRQRTFGRPNLGQKPGTVKLSRPKIAKNEKKKIDTKPRKPPAERDVSGLAVCAVGVDPMSMMQKRVQAKYDVMSSKSSVASGLTLDGSCASREEFDEMRRKEIKLRQKMREEERAKVMKELSEDAKHRKKAYEQMEAPFKKIREKQLAQEKETQEEDKLFLTIEAAKPPPVGTRAMKASDRQREVDLLIDLIKQRREEVQKMKVMQARMTDDVIMIGNMEVPVELPKTAKEKQKSSQSSQRPLQVPDLESVDAAEDQDNLAIAAIAKNTFEIPPSDDEFSQFAEFSPSKETGFFYFSGLPIDIPGVEDCDSMDDRLDCLNQFLEQGLGQEGTEEAKQVVRSISMEDGSESDFKKVFSNKGLLAYFPFVEHYIFCENYE